MCVLFCFRLLLFDSISVRFIQMFTSTRRSFPLIIESYSPVQLFHNLLIHSVLREHLSSFQFGTITKSHNHSRPCSCPFCNAVCKTTTTNQQWCIISYDHAGRLGGSTATPAWDHHATNCVQAGGKVQDGLTHGRWLVLVCRQRHHAWSFIFHYASPASSMAVSEQRPKGMKVKATRRLEV